MQPVLPAALPIIYGHIYTDTQLITLIAGDAITGEISEGAIQAACTAIVTRVPITSRSAIDPLAQ